jgi:hypothetical protein
VRARVPVIVRLEHVVQLDDVVVPVDLLKEDDFAERSLRVGRVLRAHE